jgi:hypothetical protein
VRGKTEEQIRLAWRTAYYHRVRDMPALSEELAEIRGGTAGGDEDVDEDGGMSAARADRVWSELRSGVMAWNVKLARDAERTRRG